MHMPENQDDPSGFKVVDRRLFSEDGTVRPRAKEDERKTEPARPIGRHASGSAHAAAPAPAQEEEDQLLGGSGSGFETLVSYLSTTAMFQMGLLPGPSGERIPLDLANAQRTIDMLEVLQQKTHGNLTPDEARLLEDVLYELRMGFVELQRRQAKKAK
jgi:hypothetical protein